MPTVEMPDGTLVEMPDNPTPEQLTKLRAISAIPPAPEGPHPVDQVVTGAGLAAGGGILGGAVGKTSQAIANRGRQRAFIEEAPTPEGLKTRAQDLYRSMDDSGIAFSNKSYADWTTRLGKELAEEGVDPGLHPKATALFSRISREAAGGANPSMKHMDMLRQNALDLSKSPDAAERRLGIILRKRVDDYVGGVTDADVVARAGNADLDRVRTDTGEARDLWRRKAGAEAIGAEQHKGGLAASGEESGLRNRFRAILNSENKKRQFSANQIAAMEDIVKGNFTDNALRFLGTQGFPVDQARKFLGPVVGGALGHSVGGPVGAVAGVAGGTAANAMVKANAVRNAQEVAAMVASGKPRPERASGRGVKGALIGGGLGLGIGAAGSAYAGEGGDEMPAAPAAPMPMPEPEPQVDPSAALGTDPFSAERFHAGGHEPPPELGPMFQEAAKHAKDDPNWQRRKVREIAEFLGANPEWQERLVFGADMTSPTVMGEDVVRDVGEGNYRDAAITAGAGLAGWVGGPLAAAGAKGVRKGREALRKSRGTEELEAAFAPAAAELRSMSKDDLIRMIIESRLAER